MTIKIDKDIRLELTTRKHAEALYQAMIMNRAHLFSFLPWIQEMHSVDDFREYTVNCEQLYKEGKEVSFVVFANKLLMGRISLQYINGRDRNAAIGYWPTKDAEGKGIIQKSCKVLIAYAFQELYFHRIEIRVASQNLRSLAVAEKLNFKKEGILRDAELVNNKYHDLVLYSY